MLLAFTAAAGVACGGDGSGTVGPDPDPTPTPTPTPDPSPEPDASPSYVRLRSDLGDYIGVGRSYEYTLANSVITARATDGHFTLRIEGDEWWYADFEVPQGMTQLTPGTYAGVQRYPFHDATKGGLDWSGEGRGCNALIGSFTIERVAYTLGVVLTAIDLTFEQHCEGQPAALRGTIHWRADDTTTPPGPVMPIPDRLWRPPAASLPPSGDYVYVQSDVGDYIGQGQVGVYTPANATIVVSEVDGHLMVSVGGWWGDFKAMYSLDQLRPGYYADLKRYPFHNPAKGGLSWSGNGRGCNTLRGWFVVDRVTYVDRNLTALDLRFEQHCEGVTPAFRGAIHWGA